MSSCEELKKLQGFKIWNSEGYLDQLEVFQEDWEEITLRRELEESLQIDLLEDIVYNCDLERKTETEELTKRFRTKFIYTIPKEQQQNYLTNFHIIFKHNGFDLDTYQKQMILDTKLTIRIGGQIVESIDLDCNLLLALLAGKEYKQEVDSISIPIFFFSQFNNELFPAWNTIEHKLSISIDSCSNSFSEYFTLFLKYDWFDGQKDYSEESENIIFIPYLQNSPILSSNINSIKLSGLNLTYKTILIRFVQTDTETNNISIDFQPRVESVSLAIQDKDPLYFDDITSFTFLGIKLFCVGLSPEFKDFDSMKTSLKQLLETGRFSDYGLIIPKNSYLHIDFNERADNYDVKTNFITSNSLGFYKGLVGVRLLMQI